MSPQPQIPLSAIRQPAFLYGPDGRITATNDLAEALAGRPLACCSPADVIAILRVRRPDGTPVVPAELPVSRALAGEEAIDVPLAITASDGRTVHVLATVSLLRDGGSITGALCVWQDVTERRRTEMELESTARFLAENPNPIMRLDNGRTIIYANVAARTMLGGMFTGLDTDATDDIARIATTALVSGIMHEMEYSKGDETYLLSFVPLANRHYVNIYGATITKRKRAEELLCRRVEEIETLMETVPVAIWVAQDPECREITGNRMANEFYEAREGENVSAWSPPGAPVPPRRFFAGGRELAAEEQPMQFAAAHGVEVRNAELEVLLPSGRQIFMLGSASPLREASGTVRGCLGAFLDITERKRAEEKIKESEEQVRNLIENSADGILITDEEGRITTWNWGMEMITGLAARDVLGTPGWEIQARIVNEERAGADYRTRYRALWDRLLQDGTYPHLNRLQDAQIRIPTGEIRHLQQMVFTTPTPRGFQVGSIMRDITEQKRAEVALRKFTEDLRRSNEDLERFAYVASHDLQEPLRSIVSFSQLLERRYKGRLDADADDYINFIVEGGTRMQSLILDLLAYSRVNTTRQELRSTDTADVLAGVERSLDVPLSEAGTVITHDTMPVVLADPLQLEQVFVNLISNALKFRRPDEPLRVHVGARRTDGFWEFSVADNGIGIEPEYYDRIFVIFQRLHTKDAYPGTGMGLAIVKRVIDRHGGRIWVESVPGEGSTFFFTLPAA